MGEFIDLAAVLVPVDDVRTALRKLASEAKCYSTQSDRTLVIYDDATGDFVRVQALSQELKAATFACHIHDGDLWLYEFYLCGKLADKFNSLPSHWGELPPEQEAEWKGDADLLSRHWPNLNADSIRLYLRDETESLDDLNSKAYPDDKFAYGDCWQLTDFLRKLGTPYPSSMDED